MLTQKKYIEDIMRAFIFTIVAFALFTAGLASVAHAHVDVQQGADQQIELNVGLDSKLDNENDGNEDNSLCDMHCHNHIATAAFAQDSSLKVTNKLLSLLSKAPIPSFVYGLKRPPRI